MNEVVIEVNSSSVGTNINNHINSFPAIDNEDKEVKIGTYKALLVMQERATNTGSKWCDCMIDGYEPIYTTGFEQRLVYRITSVYRTTSTEDIKDKAQNRIVSDKVMASLKKTLAYIPDTMPRIIREKLLREMIHVINKRLEEPK